MRVKVHLLQWGEKEKEKLNLVKMQWRRNIKIAPQETGYADMKWTGCFRPGSRAVLCFVMLVSEQWEVCVIQLLS